MSPEQLQTLQKLSRLFEEGVAGPDQIKLLAELLANINHERVTEPMFSLDNNGTRSIVS